MGRNFVIGTGSIGAVAVGLIIWFAIDDPDPAPGSDWGLHIVIFEVGQADAIAMVTPNGQACVIDAAHGSTGANKIAAFLLDQDVNGVGAITNVKLGFVTHYDQDHMGGFHPLINSGIQFVTIYDQGPSIKRSGKAQYKKYLEVVGDTNDNLADDEPATRHSFIRKKVDVGRHWTLGNARIRCVAVRGDTKGSAHDLDWDPSGQNIDENPGSIALLITLGEFEFYTAGDQTSDDWTGHANEDTEIAVINSGVLGSENDIDVLKVSHHGADTSTGDAFVNALDPEVAIISTKWRSDHTNPERNTIKQLAENGAIVYITGDGKDPSTNRFTPSRQTTEDDGYTPPADMVVNNAGDVHIFVSADGSQYSVVNGSTWRDFSAVDSDNARPPSESRNGPTETLSNDTVRQIVEEHGGMAPVPREQAVITVYSTRTGSKYHRNGCQYLRSSKYPVSVKEAKSRGLGPCSRCRPPTK